LATPINFLESEMLRIVTDGAADMPNEWEKTYGINVIPINIHFGEKTYLQFRDLDNDGFYKMVDETRKIPKTSQPSPHQFMEFYQQIAQAGDTVLSVHVTSKLSGTFDSAVSAARDLAGRYNIIPFDSLCGSAGIGMMCREARIMDQAGEPVWQIIKRLEMIRERISIALALDTLKYARLSGRVGTLQAALASALNVKPIITLQQGMLQMTERVRTRSASLDRIVRIIQERFGSTSLKMAVVHARDKESAELLVKKAKDTFKIDELITTDLSISVAANLGPGTVGIVAYTS
jgi:DegV family protein with EDD domain